MTGNKKAFWSATLGILCISLGLEGQNQPQPIILVSAPQRLQVHPAIANRIASQPTVNQSGNSTTTAGIWFNNAPGHKVNCVNSARYNGRSCVCAPGYHLIKIIETYDGAIVSTVWQCSNSEDWYKD